MGACPLTVAATSPAPLSPAANSRHPCPFAAVMRVVGQRKEPVSFAAVERRESLTYGEGGCTGPRRAFPASHVVPTARPPGRLRRTPWELARTCTSGGPWRSPLSASSPLRSLRVRAVAAVSCRPTACFHRPGVVRLQLQLRGQGRPEPADRAAAHPALATPTTARNPIGSSFSIHGTVDDDRPGAGVHDLHRPEPAPGRQRADLPGPLPARRRPPRRASPPSCARQTPRRCAGSR